jgi:2-polyprenyl-3-methyl-5-hydroxy-6-metoxy-1,4-benzoquinol methylase
MIAQNEIKLPANPSEVRGLLREAYQDLWGLGGFVVRYRPYICPFEELLCRIKPADEMLDVGCGVGSFSMLLANLGIARKVLGIDISPIIIAKAALARHTGQGRAMFAVMKPGSYPERQFHAVVCIDVLHHVKKDEHKNFIKSISQLVKPGGQLIFKDIAPRPRWKAVANQVHDVIMANQWVNYRQAEEVSSWLEETGLKITENVRLDRWWYGHYLLVANAN